MPRHRALNLKKFLESVPESLLQEYFAGKLGVQLAMVPAGYDFESVDSFLNSLQDENLKSHILEEFNEINDICERDMNVLVWAAQKYNIDLDDEAARQEMAMRLRLHHRDAFDYAYDYYCLFNFSSKMSHHNVMIPVDGLEITAKKIEGFKARVEQFYANLAKGHECIIRHYDDQDNNIIVVIHGSYKRSQMIWEDQKVKTVFFRPATEDILQFDKKTSVLSIKAPYNKDKENYVRAFTETIIEDKNLADRDVRDSTFTLVPLQDGTFSFAGNDTITSVWLVQVTLALRGLNKTTLKINSSNVLNALDEELHGFKLSNGVLTHAKFRFTLNVDGKKRKISFEITPPNVTDLPKKKYADIIGAYLRENGIKLV